MNSSLIKAFFLSLLGVSNAFITANAYAQGFASPQGDPNRIIQITPYIWAADLAGDISPFQRAPTVRTKSSFSEILDKLSFGAFLNLWARYDNFVFSGDMLYLNVTDSKTLPPLPTLPLPIPQHLIIDAKADSKVFMNTVQAGYRVYNSERFTLDTLAGARIWRVSNKLRLKSNNQRFSYRENINWIDPVIGLRGFLQLGHNSSILAQGVYGGFNAGSNSTWTLEATYNHKLTQHLSLSAGYRLFHVDYEKNGHVFNTHQKGPILGMTMRF